MTIVAEVTIDPGTLVAQHTHPGIGSGVATGTWKPSPAFTMRADTKTVVVSTYVVEKGKPPASPA